MKLKDIHEGAEVYWTDPDNGISSGYYTVKKIMTREGKNSVILIGNGYSETEVYLHELS